jgi:hypothetical protein
MKQRAALLLAGWLASAPLAPMGFAGDDAADPFGTSKQGRASRTIAIDASTPIVRVEHQEIVSVRNKRGQNFTWQFDTVYVPTAFPLANIAPPDFACGDTWVYVGPRPDVLAD